MFLLDTDHLSLIQWATEPSCSILADRMLPYGMDRFFVSIVSFHEQVLGWNAYLNRSKASTDDVRAYGRLFKILADFSALQVIRFDEPAAVEFDRLRKARVRIGTMDLRIAATCLARGFTLLSRNLVDFQKVPGLRVEDWTTPL